MVYSRVLTLPLLSLSSPSSIELNEPPLVHTAASLFKEMCYRYREDLMAGIIIAGWDPQEGGQVRHPHPHPGTGTMPLILAPPQPFSGFLPSLYLTYYKFLPDRSHMDRCMCVCCRGYS